MGPREEQREVWNAKREKKKWKYIEKPSRAPLDGIRILFIIGKNIFKVFNLSNNSIICSSNSIRRRLKSENWNFIDSFEIVFSPLHSRVSPSHTSFLTLIKDYRLELREFHCFFFVSLPPPHRVLSSLPPQQQHKSQQFSFFSFRHDVRLLHGDLQVHISSSSSSFDWIKFPLASANT